MTNEKRKNFIRSGEENYQRWRNRLRQNPEYQKRYDEEAAKGNLWLQLVNARQAAGLTQKQMAERLGVSQAQISRIEEEGCDAYTLNTLRKYITALGQGYSLEVRVHMPDEQDYFRIRSGQ